MEPWLIDWQAVYWKAMRLENGPVLPEQIRQLTVGELLLVLDDDVKKKRPPSGAIQFRDAGERIAYAKWWAGLSMADRIALQRRKYGYW